MAAEKIQKQDKLPARGALTFKSSRPARVRQPGGTLLIMAHALGYDLWSAALIDLAAAVNRTGLSVILQTPGGPQAAEAERRGLTVTRQPLPGNAWQRWRSARRLAGMVEAEKIGAILSFTPKWLPTMLSLPKHARPPMALHFGNPPSIQAVKQSVCTFAVRGGKFIVPSAYMQNYCLQELQIAKPAVRLVRPGINAATFDPAQMRPERVMALAELWRVPEHASLILHIGPLAPDYGIETMLLALAKLKRKDFYVVMLGAAAITPKEAARLQTLVDRYGLHGKVIAPEPCQDWPAAFWMAHLVVAANQEPLGQNPALLAAQAVGRPLIVSASGANAEFTLDGNTAEIFPVGQHKALTATLQKQMDLSSADYARIAAAGQAYVQHFPYQEWLDRMTQSCRDLCKLAVRRDMAA